MHQSYCLKLFLCEKPVKMSLFHVKTSLLLVMLSEVTKSALEARTNGAWEPKFYVKFEYLKF